MTREEVEPLFRVTSDPSWRVEYLWRGTWVVVSYCGSERAASEALQRHIGRSVVWSNMTPEQRRASVLRVSEPLNEVPV